MLLDTKTSQALPAILSGPGTETAASVKAILRRAGLRSTRQRLALGKLLFTGRHRHVTSDMLNEEALLHGEKLSVATVYNTLRQFEEAGLVRKISLHGGRTYFDTDTGDHTHFYIEADDMIIDISTESVSVGPFPPPPPGYRISKVDVLVHLICDTDSR